VQTESLVSILIGGIAFQTPPDAGVAPAADANAVFNLFDNREAAMKRPDLAIEHFVIAFKQSVRGLSVGAPVEFRGVTIGEVISIGAEFDPKAFNFVQPVEIHIYPDRLRARSRDSGAALPAPQTPEARLKRAQIFVEKGFRAQLRTGNLITGQSYVALDFFPEAPKVKLTHPGAARDPVIPRSRSRGDRRGILKKLDRCT
jgi:paraquat-inducible protein B